MSENNLLKKVNLFTAAREARQKDIYPYFRPIASAQDTEVMIRGKKVMMFGSNSYLGLTNHAGVIKAAGEALEKYGTGCAGSRFLNGTLDIHQELEQRLAGFLRKESALVLSTGFQANLGILPVLAGRNDYIFLDEFSHASLIDAARLSFARVLKFRHNDFDDLDKKLESAPEAAVKLIVTEGIFSMEGDIPPLPDIVRVAEKYGASILLDDAHGLGVLGEGGRGAADYFGLTDKIDIIMGTFSKSLASLGGFIAASESIIDYLRHHSRSLIFSASMTPASAASVLAALDIMENEPEHQEKLWRNVHYARELLSKTSLEVGHSDSPIIPIYIRDNHKTFTITCRLQEEGVFVNPVISPAVRPEDTLIRFSLMATHTFEQIEKAIGKLEQVISSVIQQGKA